MSGLAECSSSWGLFGIGPAVRNLRKGPEWLVRPHARSGKAVRAAMTGGPGDNPGGVGPERFWRYAQSLFFSLCGPLIFFYGHSIKSIIAHYVHFSKVHYVHFHKQSYRRQQAVQFTHTNPQHPCGLSTARPVHKEAPEETPWPPAGFFPLRRPVSKDRPSKHRPWRRSELSILSDRPCSLRQDEAGRVACAGEKTNPPEVSTA